MFCKDGLKDFALFFEVSNKFIIIKKCGTQEIFYCLKVFNRVQEHLGLVDGSDNFFEIFL